MHVRGGIRDAAPGGRDLDGTGASLVGNGDVGEAATLAELGLVHDLAGSAVLQALVDLEADSVLVGRHDCGLV